MGRDSTVFMLLAPTLLVAFERAPAAARSAKFPARSARGGR